MVITNARTKFIPMCQVLAAQALTPEPNTKCVFSMLAVDA
jgi:hypothetical protein